MLQAIRKFFQSTRDRSLHSGEIYICNWCGGINSTNCDGCGGSGKIRQCLDVDCCEYGCGGYGFCRVEGDPQLQSGKDAR